MNHTTASLRALAALACTLGLAAPLAAYNEKNSSAIGEGLQLADEKAPRRLAIEQSEQLHRGIAAAFAAAPLSSWLEASAKEELASDADFERAIAEAQQKGNLERSLRLAVQALIARPADAKFPARLGRAAALLELQERSLGRAGEDALADAIYGTMEKFPADDVIHQAGVLMRGVHAGLKKDYAAARDAAERVQKIPEIVANLRAPAAALAGAASEGLGEFEAAAKAYAEFERHAPPSPQYCTMVLRAAFLNLHLNRTDEALRLIGALEKADAELIARAPGADQIQQLVALKKSGKAEEYWQRGSAWWPAWEAVAKAVPLPEAAAETAAPVIATPQAHAQAMLAAYNAKDKQRFLHELRPAVSAARWLPNYVEHVASFTLARLTTDRTLLSAHRDFVYVLLEQTQADYGDEKSHRGRQRLFAAVLIERNKVKEGLALVADLRRRAPPGAVEHTALNRVWALGAERSGTEREEAAAALEADLNSSEPIPLRGHTVIRLASLYRSLTRFDDERALLARELANPEFAKQSPEAFAALTARQRQLNGTAGTTRGPASKSKIIPPPKSSAASKGGALPSGRTAGRTTFLDDGPFSLVKVDGPPKPRRRLMPAYPADLAARGIRGTVVVEFIVDTTGSVMSAKVLSSPDEALSAFAVAAVSKWQFEPGRRGGQPVNTRMQVPLTFAPGAAPTPADATPAAGAP